MGMMNVLKRFMSPDLIDINAFGVSFPSVQEAKWLTDQSFHSPDLGYLEQYEFQLLFCPDDTRLGYQRYGLIEEGVPLGTAYTQDTFSYWVQDIAGDRTPIPMRQEGQPAVRYFPPALKVKGEVHAIRPWQFRNLDDYKRNRHVFRRQRVNVLVPYRLRTTDDRSIPQSLKGKGYCFEYPEKVFVLRAWMYIGIPDYWDNLFDAGFRGFKTVNHYESRRPWLREYYDFPKRPLE